MRQVARAMLTYSEDHGGRLPPHAVCSKDGQPLLSWRVLLLPYLGEEALYRQFKLDEPWDSAHNKALLPRMPEVYAPLPREEASDEPFSTYYQVFVGKGTAFEGKQGLHLTDDFPDGLSNTILLIEGGQTVPWTKPVDLVYAADQPLPALGGQFRGEGTFRGHGRNEAQGYFVAFASGSIFFLKASISEATLRKAITRDGGEELCTDW